MTMEQYYRMSIGAGIELREKVGNLGEFLREEFVPKYYRHAKVYKYENNVYYIDCVLGIIDIL